MANESDAPAPRLPDGHPDLSGLWHAAQPGQCVDRAGNSVPCGLEIGGSPLGGNLGRNLPGGTLPYQPWAAKLFQERHAVLSIDDPHVRCLPDNPPRSWTLPHLTKAVHTPKLLVLLDEVNAMYRQLFIDGRPFPDDPTPAWTRSTRTTACDRASLRPSLPDDHRRICCSRSVRFMIASIWARSCRGRSQDGQHGPFLCVDRVFG